MLQIPIQQPVEMVTTRMNPHVHPHLHVWGYEIPTYLFLGGLVGGILILSSLLGFMAKKKGKQVSPVVAWMPLVSLGLLSVGMLFLFLDLSHKLYVWRFYTAFEWTSPMSWGAWILLIVYPVGFLLSMNLMDEKGREKVVAFCPMKRLGMKSPLKALADWAAKRSEGLLTTGMFAGIALAIYTGILLANNGGRVVWSSALMGPLFLASGLSTGAAFFLLFRSREEEHSSLLRLDIIAIIAELVLLFLLFLGYGTSGTGGHSALSNFLGGPWTAPFFGLVVFLGLLVPLGMELYEKKHHAVATRLVPILVLIGGFFLRYVLVASGQAISIAQVTVH